MRAARSLSASRPGKQQLEGTAGMPIYEKPTRELMREFAAQKLEPGQVFSRKDAV